MATHSSQIIEYLLQSPSVPASARLLDWILQAREDIEEDSLSQVKVLRTLEERKRGIHDSHDIRFLRLVHFLSD